MASDCRSGHPASTLLRRFFTDQTILREAMGMGKTHTVCGEDCWTLRLTFCLHASSEANLIYALFKQGFSSVTPLPLFCLAH